ncbi:hypothetical protein SAMN02745119_00465 [Trichlorobacter thiogenes]|uniref:Uncharacterized protein n=1 Tax=Trichlorobacter thiogenes TaxID=115783 RepID=A0A1T4KBS8_9BACT|nr:hypothetical protein [Trichlorobacter thiogenes]SJZ39890.1 hypothetical protein SAMN02745119_00465 [Trichlorobacter thiogenes]
MFYSKISLVFMLCLILGASGSLAAAESKFLVQPIDAGDKTKLQRIFKPLESKWVPQQELSKYPGLYWQDDLQKQSFRIASEQKGLEDVYFVPVQADYEQGTKAARTWSQSVSFLIIDRKNGEIRPLPTHPAMEWSFDHIESVAFRDVQGNGQRAIVIDVAAITGIGPTGTEPFDVFAVYLPAADGSWTLDEKLQQLIDRQLYKKCNASSCRTLGAVLKVSKDYFRDKKVKR